MANPGDPTQQGDDPDPLNDRMDKLADRMEPHRSLDEAGNVAEHLVPMGGRMVGEMNKIAADLGVEAELDKKMLTDIDTALHEQSPAEAPGVDIAAIKQVDAGFDEMSFRTLARETFYKVREARTFDNPEESSALLSPTMQAQLTDAVGGDVASHRHHLLPYLTVVDATLVGAGVVGGREQLDVKFQLSGAEVDRDSTTLEVVGGSEAVTEWNERWRFERDPSVDTSAGDEQHILSYGPDQWMIAHRGWVVTAIERLLSQIPGTPSA